ncbi:MAG TPA: TetR family transcriptional regulator C-terminal domain-containing protein [Segeticoccus sp.]|uniref:TetR/AcrR family transcriptional regulator n=1 Tax=Segeticoccus sp. TaxID=2706531 RepID=UPI002D7E22BA|nr:TetR family transcriptional regulator C-terminal domain-containing protein [Segeticoccus sp.]HET8599781.1 TetR family transcriptional regulator C-terminal domain-containing protein [Segeticoccus sp.]
MALREATTAASSRRGTTDTGSATREAILKAACRVIAETGFERIRMRMVGEAAGVSTATLHYHFATREKLFAEALRFSFVDTGADVYGSHGASDTATARLARIISASLPSSGPLRREWALWMELWCRAIRDKGSSSLCADLYRQHNGWIEATIRDGIEAGEFTVCDPASHAQLISSLCDGYGVQLMTAVPTLTVKDARQVIWRVASGPLGIDPDFPLGGKS